MFNIIRTINAVEQSGVADRRDADDRLRDDPYTSLSKTFTRS